MTTKNEPKPVLAVSLALVMSVVGFVTSLLAICVLWLVPTWKPATPNYHPRTSRSQPRHPQVPMNPPAILRRPSVPRPTSPAPLVSPAGAETNSRRVSFNLALSQVKLLTNSARRRKTPVPYQEYIEPSSSSMRSASSSTSTLVDAVPFVNEGKTRRDLLLQCSESGDDSNLDSDSSHFSSTSSLNRKSHSLSAHLPNMKNVFRNRRKRMSVPESLDLNLSSPVYENIPKPARSSTMPTTGPWSTPRYPSPSEPIVDTQSTPKSAKRLSFTRVRTPTTPSFFSLKSDRRSPAPSPRTQPYGPPYYAPTPVSADGTYSWYLKGLPQFEDDLSVRTVRKLAVESEDVDRVALPSAGSTWDRHQRKDTQAALGYGLPTTRHASNTWIPEIQSR